MAMMNRARWLWLSWMLIQLPSFYEASRIKVVKPTRALANSLTTRALAAVPATLVIENDNLLGVEEMSFETSTYSKTNVVENQLAGGASEVVWTGSDGPFLCVIVQKRNTGAIAAHFTTLSGTYEILTDPTGQLFARFSQWGAVRNVFNQATAPSLSSFSTKRLIQGSLFERGGVITRQRRLQTRTDTVVKVLTLVLNRASCEQALVQFPCDVTDDNTKAPIEARLSLLEAEANMAMQNSEIPVEVQMRHWVHVDSTFDVDTTSSLLDLMALDANVAFWRAQTGADLVIMITGSSQEDRYAIASRVSDFVFALSYNTLQFFTVSRVLGHAFGAQSSRGSAVLSRLSTVGSDGCPIYAPCPIVNAYSSSTIQWSDRLSSVPLILGDFTNNNALMIRTNRAAVANLNRELQNDLCIGAIPRSSSTRDIFSTVGALEDYREETCNGVPITAPGVWFTADGNGQVLTFSTCQMRNFNTRISVYAGSSCDQLFCVAANEDGGCSGGSLATWASVRGTKYFVLVHGLGSETGTFQVDFSSRTAIIPALPQPSSPPLRSPPLPALPLPSSPTVPQGVPVPAPPPLCFSDSNMVVEQDAGEISIDQVRVGSLLQTERGVFSRVFSLAHYHTDLEALFIQIYTGNSAPLEITGDHLVFVNGTAARASHVKVGDLLGDRVVTHLSIVKRRGVYAPLTESGELIVSGIRVSSYVGLLSDTGTVWNQHTLGQLLFSPMRIFCRWHTRYCASETHDETGYSNLYSWVIWLCAWIGWGGAVPSFFVSVAATPFLLVFWVVEQVTSNNIFLHFLLIVSGAVYLRAHAPRVKKANANLGF